MDRTAPQDHSPADAIASQTARAARDGLRRPLLLTGLVNFGLHYSQRWPVRDLSTTGAYIEMPGRGLKADMDIEFVLRVTRGDRTQELRLPAKVVRVDDNGAAVTFGEYEDSIYTALVNLLYSG